MNKLVKYIIIFLISLFCLISIVTLAIGFIKKIELKNTYLGIGAPTAEYSIDMNSSYKLYEKNENLQQIYFSIENNSDKVINPNLYFVNRDWFTNKEILNSALENLNKDASDKEKSIALWKFVSENVGHFHPPFYGASYKFVDSPVQLFNVWGYGYCSDVSNVLAQLNTMAGIEARVVQLNSHIVMESFYDGDWHLFDSDRGLFFEEDGAIVNAEYIVDNKHLIDQTKEKLDMSDDFYDFKKDWYHSPFDRNPTEYRYKDRFYQKLTKNNMNYNLMPGEKIIFFNDWNSKFFWEYRDESPIDWESGKYFFTNGILETHNTSYRKVSSNIDYNLYLYELPYPFVKVIIIFEDNCKSVSDLYISLDGMDWNKLNSSNCFDSKIIAEEQFFKVGEGYEPIYRFYLKTSKENLDFIVISQFQVSKKSIPFYTEEYENDELKQYSIENNVELRFGFDLIN